MDVFPSPSPLDDLAESVSEIEASRYPPCSKQKADFERKRDSLPSTYPTDAIFQSNYLLPSKEPLRKGEGELKAEDIDPFERDESSEGSSDEMHFLGIGPERQISLHRVNQIQDLSLSLAFYRNI